MGVRILTPAGSVRTAAIRPGHAIARLALRGVVMTLALGSCGGSIVPASFTSEAEESMDPVANATTHAMRARTLDDTPRHIASHCATHGPRPATRADLRLSISFAGHRLANGLLAPLRR